LTKIHHVVLLAGLLIEGGVEINAAAKAILLRMEKTLVVD
jgi:hypothetical protein